MEDTKAKTENQLPKPITKILTHHVPGQVYIDIVAIQTNERIRTMPEVLNKLLLLGIEKYNEQKQA